MHIVPHMNIVRQCLDAASLANGISVPCARALCLSGNVYTWCHSGGTVCAQSCVKGRVCQNQADSAKKPCEAVCTLQGLYHVHSKWMPIQEPQALLQAVQQRTASHQAAAWAPRDRDQLQALSVSASPARLVTTLRTVLAQAGRP